MKETTRADGRRAECCRDLPSFKLSTTVNDKCPSENVSPETFSMTSSISLPSLPENRDNSDSRDM